MERPKPRARKARRPQQHANETRNATARTGRKRGIQPTKLSAATQPVRDGRTTCRFTISSKQTRPLTLAAAAAVQHNAHGPRTPKHVSQKLLNTAPERKGRTQDVDSCGIHAEYIYPDIHAGYVSRVSGGMYRCHHHVQRTYQATHCLLVCKWVFSSPLELPHHLLCH